MTTMHTPGEWGIATINNGLDDDEIVTITNGCLVSICSVFGDGEYSEARPNGEMEPSYSVSKYEAKANARLISAAPDMLAALRAAVASAEGIARRNKQEAPFWTLEAKAAIDKATGASNG